MQDALPSDLDKLLNGSIDLSGTEVDFSELNALLDPLLFSAAPQASGLDALLLSPPALVSSSPTLNMAGLDSAFGGSPQFMLPTLGSPEAFHLPALDLDALLVPHNSQSFSSLETLAADMPSPHNDSSSDSASDRVGSPEWGHAIPDDEHARGADLLSSLTPRERELLQVRHWRAHVFLMPVLFLLVSGCSGFIHALLQEACCLTWPTSMRLCKHY